MSLFTDEVSNLITNNILNNLGCFASANQLTQAQLININCNPPSNWGQVVYNGEICSLARQTLQPNDPNLCTFCYACCLTDTNQSNFLQVTSNCGIDDKLLNKIKISISNQLSTLNPNVKMPASLGTLLDTLTTEGVNKAITNILSVQNININGIGVQSRINQNIVASIMLNTIRTPEFIQALNTYLSDLKKEQIVAPKTVPVTSTPSVNKPLVNPSTNTSNKPNNNNNISSNTLFTTNNIIIFMFVLMCIILSFVVVKYSKTNLSK